MCHSEVLLALCVSVASAHLYTYTVRVDHVEKHMCVALFKAFESTIMCPIFFFLLLSSFN